MPVFSEAAPRVLFSMQIVDLSTGQTYPGATVRACGTADVTCEAPVTEPVLVDERGWVDLPLFAGFTGFIEITGPSLVPYLLYLTDPLPPESVTEYPLAVLSQATLEPLVRLLGLPYRPETGVVALRAFDCGGSTASGVSFSFSSDAEGVPWYFVDGLPNRTVTVTSGDGIGGLGNADPGLTVVEALAPDGASISGPQSLVIRPGWVSGVYLRPRSWPPARAQ